LEFVMRPAYQFRLELFDEQGQAVHDLALAGADFNRAIETAFFDGLPAASTPSTTCR